MRRRQPNTDGHIHANGDSDSYSDAYGYTDGYTNTDANCDCYGDGYSDGHFNTYSNAYARGQTYADAQAAADDSSAGAALIGTLKGGNSRNQFASSPPEGGWDEQRLRAAIELLPFLKSEATARTLWQGVPATAEGNRTRSFR